MNWVDWVIVLYAGYGALLGFWRGFMALLFQVISLVVATVLTFLLFPKVGGWLESQIHVASTYAQPLSLAILYVVLLFGVQFFGGLVQRLIAPLLSANPLNRAGGALLGAVRHLVILSIVLAVLVTLPTPKELKGVIDASRLAQPLIGLALGLDKSLGQWSHGVGVRLGFQLVGPDDTGSTPLNYTEPNPTEDVEGELKMLALIETLRDQNKKARLTPNVQLQLAAGAHAKDMMAKNYFGHKSPEGADALARIQAVKLTVTAVGENLAKAQTVELAQAGLLASTGHRKTMLSEDFNSVGIAVMDAGRNGKVVVQLFAKTP